jgi:hypothetical protein
MADSCESLRTEVRGQEQLITGLQAELQQASPAEKAFLIAQIREAKQELGKLKIKLTTCEQTNPQPDAVVLTTDTCPVCTQEQISAWRHVVLNQLGVDGIDVDGHWIGGFPNDSKQFLPNINNWFPLSVEKRVLCAQLHHFDFYDPWTSGDEADWNNFMVPTPAFSSLLEDAKIYDVTSQWHDCLRDGAADCMEAEITPDQTYYENLFNSKRRGESNFEGQTVCTYGPWVREWSHDNRPEIHPSELYWFRNQLADGNFEYTLMQLQDDSNRFDREGDYDFGAPWDDPPSGWRAWSQVPRTNRFRIAFELDPSAPTRTFRIRQNAARSVVEKWNDQTPGSSHDLQYNGRNVLRVDELLPIEAQLGVAFGAVCRNQENTRLQGYIALIATVGLDDRGGEGYQTLQVDVDEPPFLDDDFVGEWPPFSAIQLLAPAPLVQLKAKPASLRRIETDSGPKLAGDAEVQIAVAEGEIAASVDLSDLNVELVTKSGRKSLAFRSAGIDTSRAKGGTIEEIPLTEEATLEVDAGGEKVTVPVPTLALTPQVVAESPQRLTKADRSWKSLAKAAAGREVDTTPPASVERSRRWRIEVAPNYAPVRQGKPSPGEDSPFAEALNDVVRGRSMQRLNEVFGTAKPFRATWSFRATNLTTGKRVPVKRGETAAPTDVRVDIPQANVLSPEINVTFPERPVNDVFELVATAKVRDPFGVEGTVEHLISSHVLTQSDSRELARSIVRTAGSLAETSPDELEAASDLSGPIIDHQDDNPRVPDLRTSRATMVRLLAMDASQDQRVTVDELRKLAQSAKLFAGTK